MPSGSRSRASWAFRKPITVSVKTSSTAAVASGSATVASRKGVVPSTCAAMASGPRAATKWMRCGSGRRPFSRSSSRRRTSGIRPSVSGSGSFSRPHSAGGSSRCRIDGRRVRPPDDAGPEGARLVGHPVLHPEPRQEHDVREARHHLQVGVEPRVGVEEEVEGVHAGEARHPRAVHDEGHRNALGHAAPGGGEEVLPVLREGHGCTSVLSFRGTSG